MEAMHLQPVKANMTYPSRISRVLDLSNSQDILDIEPILSGREVKRLPFIEANTKEVSMEHLKSECIVPVFSKDNEITISHPNFIETVWEAANRVFPNDSIELPEIRVSHIIKGRTPEAIHKSVKDLLEEDKTIYYERMMFCFEIPSIHEDINGNRLNLTIGGVRAYNHENLYSKKGIEKFKIFIGFKNMVCCNMCVSTDGCAWTIECSHAAISRIQCSQTPLLYGCFQGQLYDRTSVCTVPWQVQVVPISSCGTEKDAATDAYD